MLYCCIFIRKGKIREVKRIIRTATIEENMSKMPDMIRSFIQEKQKEKDEELAKSVKSEKQIYLRLTGKLANEPTEWAQDREPRRKKEKTVTPQEKKKKKK